MTEGIFDITTRLPKQDMTIEQAITIANQIVPTLGHEETE